MSEYGDPDHNYGNFEELAQAVAEFPERFSQDTHDLVSQLAETAIALEKPAPTLHVTQPTQTPTY